MYGVILDPVGCQQSLFVCVFYMRTTSILTGSDTILCCPLVPKSSASLGLPPMKTKSCPHACRTRELGRDDCVREYSSVSQRENLLDLSSPCIFFLADLSVVFDYIIPSRFNDEKYTNYVII